MSETKQIIELQMQDVTDKIDKAAAKFEDFSKSASKSVEKLNSKLGNMSENQKRAYDALKRSTEKNISEMSKLEKEYEALREKQQKGIELTAKECSDLRLKQSRYNSLTAEIKRNCAALNSMDKGLKGLCGKLTDSATGFELLKTAVAGAGSIAFSWFAKNVKDFVVDVGKLGFQVEQTISQFSALTKTAAGGAYAYEAFNDAARNTNYGFHFLTIFLITID